MLEDRRLISKFRHGNRDAFCRIYEKYRDDLLRVAAGLLHDKSDAEDAVHETFIRFVRDASKFTLTGSLKGYLMTCVANRARNLNRSSLRRPTVTLDQAASVVSNLKRPDQWIIEDEDFRRIRHAMTQLPYPQREAVALRLQGNMRFKDIATLQETTVKTVISRYRYGLTKLRSLLGKEETQ